MPGLYSWRAGSRFKVDPMVAAAELNRIAAEAGGEVQADAVVAAARDAANPLHPEFEWHDEEAAAEWRRHQARQMLGSLIVVTQTSQVAAVEVRAFINVATSEGKSYRVTTDAMADPELRLRILSRALSDLRALQLKYATLQELATVFAATEEVVARARQEGAA